MATGVLVSVEEYLRTSYRPDCDPVKREGWVATPGLLGEATDGILRASGIEMPLAEILE